jgi:hypothetical protein
MILIFRDSSYVLSTEQSRALEHTRIVSREKSGLNGEKSGVNGKKIGMNGEKSGSGEKSGESFSYEKNIAWTPTVAHNTSSKNIHK